MAWAQAWRGGGSTKCEKGGAQGPARSVGRTVCACGCGEEQAGQGDWRGGARPGQRALHARLKLGFILPATGSHRGYKQESEEVGCVLRQWSL